MPKTLTKEALIKENKELAERLKEVDRYLHGEARFFFSIGELHRSLDLEHIYNVSVKVLVEVFGVRSCAIMVVDEITKELDVVATRGDKTVDMDIVNEVAQTGKLHIKAPLCCYPFVLEKKVLGLFVIMDLLPQKKSLSEEDYELLVLLAEQSAVAIQRTREWLEVQEKLVRHEKLAAMGQLASIVGHEVRGPLGVIRNSVYFLGLRLGKNPDEKVKKHLGILQEEVDISDKIISDILDFARVKELVVTTVSVKTIVEDAIKRLNVPANIEIVTKLGDDLPHLVVDASQIQRVFSNIMLNALQAMPNGGSLTIATTLIDADICISFTDTGHGIPKENLQKIFEPLFSTRGKGTGLGLVVCQNIIQAHKGAIEVESEVEKGTIFKVKLPVKI